MPKRFRKPNPKQGELLVKFGKADGEIDLLYCWPENTCGMRRDTRLVMNALERIDVYEGKSLRQELTERGYDITTLKFSITKINPEASNE